MARTLKDQASATILAVAVRTQDSDHALQGLRALAKLPRSSTKKDLKKSVAAIHSQEHSEEQNMKLLFNPGANYKVYEDDLVFVIADEAKR